jgi:hypothetical protein
MIAGGEFHVVNMEHRENKAGSGQLAAGSEKVGGKDQTTDDKRKTFRNSKFEILCLGPCALRLEPLTLCGEGSEPTTDHSEQE